MKLLPLILLSLFSANCLDSQSLSFRHLSTENGLSQGHINALLKDSRGLLWEATQDGINRFDAYEFRHFKHDPSRKNSLAANYVWCLLETSDGKIWAGTFGKGISVFDPVREQFNSFNPVPLNDSTTAPNSIRTLCEFPKGKVWIGTDLGLWTYNLESNQLNAISNGAFFRPFQNVTVVQPVNPKHCLIGSGTGLYLFASDSGALDSLGMGIPGVTVHAIAAVDSSHFLIGTNKGLKLCSINFKTRNLNIEKHITGLPDDFVSCLLAETEGYYWVGTNQGLSRVSLNNNHIETWQHESDNASSLSSDIVTCLMEIQPGYLWAGTREGINQFSIQSPAFKVLGGSEGSSELCSDAVLGMMEDEEHNLWVATRKGLSRVSGIHLPKDKRAYECITPANTASMPYDYVIRVKKDRSGKLWALFRRNGFAMLHKRSGGGWFFEKPDFTKGQIPPELGLNDLEQDEDGVYWLSTQGLGLHSWNPATGEYLQFRSSNDSASLRHDYVFGTYHDSQQRLWVATANGGLCLMDKANGRFQCFTNEEENPGSISSNMVLSVFEDSRVRLWACTANGLNLMKTDGSFQRFYRGDGLPNDVIYGMLEDEEGALWVSTNGGLARLHFKDSSLSVQHYDHSDGLPGNEFNQHSFLKLSDGRLCFGGVNGLSIFQPADVKPYPDAPEVAITGLLLFNQSTTTDQEVYGFRLPAALNELDEIVLRHDQNFIALEFAALSFADPSSNEYAYYLEGLENDWVFSEKRRFASYPGLSPGSYTFHVKAANQDGVWNEQPRSIRITVLQPWWNTWWAWTAYLLLAAGLVYLFLRQREAAVRRVEAAKSAERESLRKRMARDFHDEAGNRITKLALMTEVMKRSQKVDENLVEDIQSNIQELRSGMRDFIWVLNPENDNLQDTFIRLRDAANSVFEHSDINLSTGSLSDLAETIALDGNQRRHIMMLFKEAASNCVRHSGASEAELSISMEEDHFEIWLQDNGSGFRTNEYESGNGLKNMQVRAKKAGGTLRIESNNGAGTRIVFRSQFTQTGN